MSTKSHENEQRYQDFWSPYSIDDPQKWPHWKIIKPYLHENTRALEIGSGVRPKIPIEGGTFIDISTVALKKLFKEGGNSVQSDLDGIPIKSESFDIICAFEILEHLPNDNDVLANLNRVLKPDGKVFVSFPLHKKLFNEYDTAAGHVRRYESSELENLFKSAGFQIEKYSGMDVPWPDPKTAKVLSFLDNKIPMAIPLATKIIDSLPFVSMRKPIQLKNWESDAALTELNQVSTGFFVLQKT